MCGLVSMVTKNRNGFTNANLDMFDLMLFVDQLRGQDSTGVFLVNNVGNVTIAKEAVHSTDFLARPDYRNVRTDAIRNGWAMVGHNRKATRGSINDENAHPFWVEDKLVLVHNGSMYGSHKELADVEVDSAAIAHVLAEHGQEKVPEALQKINAAYALIWYDVQGKRLNIIRNEQRPLFWMETGDAWFMCSEPDFMVFAARRCNVQILDNGPHAFDVGNHSKWILNADRSTGVDEKDVDFKYRAHVAPSVPPLPSSTQSSRDFLADGEVRQLRHWMGYEDIEEVPLSEIEHARRVGEEIAADNELQARRDRVESARKRLEAKREAGQAIAKAALEAGRELMKVETRPMDAPIPDWSKVHTYGDWMKLKETYKTGARVRVECRDYISNDAGPGMIYMTGKTVDDAGLWCIFPITKELFDAITSPNSSAARKGAAEFMVDIDACGWKGIGTEAERTADKFENWRGVVTITGKKAKMYSDGIHQVQ